MYELEESDPVPRLMPDYAVIIEAFKAAETEDGRVLSTKFAEAAKKIVPIYEKIFGNGVVSTLLKRDLEGSADGVVSAVLENTIACEHVDSLVTFEVTNTPDLKTVKDNNAGVVRLLWMKRALDFILAILKKVVVECPEKEIKDCAREAYSETLQQYHGYIVSKVFTMAMSVCPSRPDLLKRLDFHDEATARLHYEAFENAMGPILAKAHKALEDNGCDFPDQVTAAPNMAS
eukprot:GHVU01157004.1.p1 GENE.GHVU01157004.1~~GHVU01157004.1.p1  ORF type:complete len:232 (-),score=46.47 GHVU01157004.1:1069-1764(-)